MRGNRCQKVHSSSYQAFDSLGYPHLATLGIDVDWNDRYLLRVEGAYKPCFKVSHGRGVGVRGVGRYRRRGGTPMKRWNETSAEAHCEALQNILMCSLLSPAPPTPSPLSQLDSSVIRIPIVPGSDPRLMYGDLAGRGVRGVVLEAFGVGNLPDDGRLGWLPWLRDQRRKVCGGVSVSVSFG